MWNTPSKHTIILDTDGTTVVEQYSNAVETIETEHAQIHKEKGFFYSTNFTVANTTDKFFVLENPAGNYPHLRIIGISIEDTPCDFYVYENPTYTGGTARTVYNLSRSSSNTPDLVVSEDPTVTANGTQIEYQYLAGSGGGPVGQGASGISTDDLPTEWILKPNEDYLIRLYNNSGGAIDADLRMFWYEL
jgi:hypothetical protein